MVGTLFLGYPFSTGTLILGTIIIAAIATFTFYKGWWKL